MTGCRWICLRDTLGFVRLVPAYLQSVQPLSLDRSFPASSSPEASKAIDRMSQNEPTKSFGAGSKTNPYESKEMSPHTAHGGGTSNAPPLSMPNRIILSAMMFFQFAIWGSWVIIYYPFLLNRGFTPVQATSITANMYLGAIISTLFAGYLADRWINSERLMGICHLLGAGLLYLMTQVTSPDQYTQLFIITFVYSLVFNPTLSVINSLTFRNVPDGARDFPWIRVFGTVGWICAGYLIDFLFSGSSEGADGKLIANTIASTGPLSQAAVVSLLFGIYCLVALPKTPPTGAGKGAFDFLRALAMLKDFNFAVFFFVTLIASIAMGMYFNSAGDYLAKAAKVEKVGMTLAIGQIVELALLVALPFVLKKFGIKMVLAIGLFSWALRYFLFANGGAEGMPLMLAILGIALHGFCFDFFFAAGFIHVDKTAPKDLRASAQALLGVLVYGLGTWLGTLACGILNAWYTTPDGTRWYDFWMVPTGVLFATFIAFVLLFRVKPGEDVAA